MAMEEFVDILIGRFGEGRPILVSDILPLFPDVSRVTVYQRIDMAISEGLLERYDRGVYYIPRQGLFGKVPLSAETVVERKYIAYGDKVFGYYSGLTLENRAGLSEQVPAVLEITTNAASKGVRSLGPVGGWKDVRIRKTRCVITAENVDVLMFLDALTSLSPKEMDAVALRNLGDLARKAGRDQAFSYATYYPSRTSKRLIESEELGVFEMLCPDYGAKS